MFITIEGIEGSGKSTQVRMLAESLERDGLDVRVTREPGGTPLGERLRALLLHDATAISPLAELHLILADRAEHVATVIRPALERGQIVLCDRFSESTLAYQAYGRRLPLEVVRGAEASARQGLLPDLTFVLDCRVEIGLARTRERRGAAGADRFESEGTDFHERVRAGFLALAAEARERLTVIDADRSAATVQAEILAAARAKRQAR